MDDQNIWVEAVAVSNGVIVQLGTMLGIERYIGTQTEIVDLAGKFALPLFVDSHMHPLSNAYAYLFQVALFDLETTQDYLGAIQKFTHEHPDMKGIIGAGFERTLYRSSKFKKKEIIYVQITPKDWRIGAWVVNCVNQTACVLSQRLVCSADNVF